MLNVQKLIFFNHTSAFIKIQIRNKTYVRPTLHLYFIAVVWEFLCFFFFWIKLASSPPCKVFQSTEELLRLLSSSKWVFRENKLLGMEKNNNHNTQNLKIKKLWVFENSYECAKYLGEVKKRWLFTLGQRINRPQSW